ncbi:BnaC03g57730D [Brassica napus]|uniref:BnaC03g57730D protein n=2 Tax=Brassica napus TaxID=3708 RepID=A0A078FBN7_BRANA|nr:BnaC03g57730D [Brassica napus]
MTSSTNTRCSDSLCDWINQEITTRGGTRS